MSEEVRKAAERLYIHTTSTQAVPCQPYDRQFFEDIYRLAEAYLAEHPADEDRAIDLSWCIARVGSSLVGGLYQGDEWLPELLVPSHRGRPTWLALPSGCTRGQFLAICRALGITLQE